MPTALRIGVGSNEGSGGGDNQIDFRSAGAVPSALVALNGHLGGCDRGRRSVESSGGNTSGRGARRID